ncbi:hypothetical protein HJC23_013637 [Cyclotella cryptica]|uniref:Helicase ATP-binding domain-containing protein n=1 Tax=Cyclotella cryptica TaxID=29204 RepID=A0ABD3P887_9STRA|eukprot:CCRYP_016518-RA/>CCRYP_016518-RA protein AED:0.02 eAED:0.02 QI:199/1/1/1/1/1/3/849/1065
METSHQLHQALTTLTAHYFPYLTLHDLHSFRLASKSIYNSLQYTEYTKSRDGNDYLVPFPGFPGILSTRNDIHSGAGLFCHQLASLHAMHLAENASANLAFGSLRGGILGDAPGLGKTITMLALICSTAGLKPVDPPEFYDLASINQHWQLMRGNVVFREEILKALRPIRDWAAQQDSNAARLYRELCREVCPPYVEGRFPTLQSFEWHVYSKMRGIVPQYRLDLFRRNVVRFKAGLDKRNRQFLRSTMGKRILLERNLIPCSTTLVIVPDALLEHWAEQIRRHVNLEVFADPSSFHRGDNNGKSSHGVVYIDGVGDLSTARFPLNHMQMPLPSAFQLMGYVFVIVPFSRIKERNQNKKRRRDDDGDYTSEITFDGYFKNAMLQSSLLQLRWFRIVVDEGHELGENEAENDVTKFINEIAAERRWVLSGTPTTGDEDSTEFNSQCLDQLQRLLIFLRHEMYGILPPLSSVDSNTYNSKGTIKDMKHCRKKQAKSAWDNNVKTAFLNKQESGREELYRVLNEVMVMHKKEDLSLPKPIFKQADINVHVPFDVQSKIVEAVSMDESNMDTLLPILSELGVDIGTRKAELHNLLPRAIKSGGQALFDAMIHQYFYTDNYQKLVDEAQGNYISDSIKKAKINLDARGGPVLNSTSAPITAATDKTIDFGCNDRRPIKAVVYSSSLLNLADVTEYLHLSFKSENIAELNMGRIANMSYELGRFRNGKKEGKLCPICGGWNDYIGKKLMSCYNLIMEVSDFSGRTFLVEPQRVLRAVGFDEESNPNLVGNPVDFTRLQGESLYKYGLVSQKHWRVGDALKVDMRDPHPLLQKRWSREVWKSYGSEKCVDLIETYGGLGRDGYLGPLPVYDNGSNEVFVKLNKWQQCGKFHGRSRWYTGPTVEHTPIRTEVEDVFILCLDAALAHGLDLSFVTHLFLLEPIDDAALLEQVTSRAHRLGSTGPVIVETVNVWPELDPKTSEKAKKLTSTSTHISSRTTTCTAVCDHCYRSFETIEKAQIHEKTCDRNPDSAAIIDPFHLSSIYRDIRPPPPILAGQAHPIDRRFNGLKDRAKM